MLRWGILGTSYISSVVANAIQASPDSEIRAVFGRDASRLQTFASRFSITITYTAIDQLLNDTTVDIVYIGLPSHKHAEVVIAAAAKGKAILSEKSLATTMIDAHAMIAAVRNYNVLFVEGLMYLSHPLISKAMEIIRGGRLGVVKSVSGHYSVDIVRNANPLGMGTIYNLGCYAVSLLHLVIETAYGPGSFGARSISGQGNLAHDDGVTHVRDAAVSARFDAGVLATIQSTDSFGNDFSFVVQGDRGKLRFETNPWAPRIGESILHLEIYKKFGGQTDRIVVESDLDAFGHQVKMIERCVKDNTVEAPHPSPTWDSSLEIMSFLTDWESDIIARVRGQ